MHNAIDPSPSHSGNRLRRLPTEAAPPYNWQEFQRRARLRLPAMGRRMDVGLAAAAVAVICIGSVAIWSRSGEFAGRQVLDFSPVANSDAEGRAALMNQFSDTSNDWAASAMTNDVGPNRTATDSASEIRDRMAKGSTDAELATNAATNNRALTASSRAVENWLASLPREPALVHVGTRAAIADLEDRIAQVDDMLTSERVDGTRPERLVPLQQERMQLVGSLAQVRYAEVVAAQSR